jgi:hypothetical protein
VVLKSRPAVSMPPMFDWPVLIEYGVVIAPVDGSRCTF